jgi:hypothetical protein
MGVAFSYACIRAISIGRVADRGRACGKNGALDKERHLRKLVMIGFCALTSCSGQPCQVQSGASIRAGSDSVGFGDRAGAPNYFCQPGVCQSTGINDPIPICLGGFVNAPQSH